jgi:hypothetical protein
LSLHVPPTSPFFSKIVIEDSSSPNSCFNLIPAQIPERLKPHFRSIKIKWMIREVKEQDYDDDGEQKDATGKSDGKEERRHIPSSYDGDRNLRGRKRKTIFFFRHCCYEKKFWPANFCVSCLHDHFSSFFSVPLFKQKTKNKKQKTNNKQQTTNTNNKQQTKNKKQHMTDNSVQPHCTSLWIEFGLPVLQEVLFQLSSQSGS